MMTPFEKLRERKVGQWTVAYVAVAWGTLQILDFLSSHFAWAPWIVRSATIFLILNVLTAIVLAWYHGEQGRQRVRGLEAGLLAICILSAFGGAWVVAKTPTPTEHAAPIAETTLNPSSVAVLPFANIGATENQYFSDGITEEILDAIARVPGLQVAARTSSFAFRGKDTDSAAIANQLHVAHLLTGSVQRAGDRIRVVSQLSDVRANRIVWSGKFDSNANDLFALEDSISKIIAQQLSKTIAAGTSLTGVGTANDSAHTLYLLGRSRWATRKLEPLHQAVSFFEQAVKADPKYAQAHAGLALALSVLPNYDNTVDAHATFDRASREARTALGLDSLSDEAYAALGEVAQYEDRSAESEQYESKAISINYNNATAHQWLAEALATRGKVKEALVEINRAIELDPLSPVMYNVRLNVHDGLGMLEDAMADANAALRIDSTFDGALSGQLQVAIEQRKFDIARNALHRILDPSHQGDVADAYIDGLADPAKRPASLKLLHSLDKPGQESVLAFAAENAGDHEFAIQLAQRADKAGQPYYWFNSRASNYGMKRLNNDPRFPRRFHWPRP